MESWTASILNNNYYYYSHYSHYYYYAIYWCIHLPMSCTATSRTSNVDHIVVADMLQTLNVRLRTVGRR